MMECINYVLEQSCSGCLCGKLSLSDVSEVFLALCKHMPYWGYATLSWLCTELESGTWRATSNTNTSTIRFCNHLIFLTLLK